MFEDANEHRLGMGSHVVIGVHSVLGFGDDLAIDREQGTERVVTADPGERRELEGTAEEGVEVHDGHGKPAKLARVESALPLARRERLHRCGELGQAAADLGDLAGKFVECGRRG